MRRITAAALSLALASSPLVAAAGPADEQPAAAPADGQAEPKVKATAIAMPHLDVPEDVMVAVMRSLEAGMKKNPRLEMRDLDSRLADFAQELPSDQIEAARQSYKDGFAALNNADVSTAVARLEDAVGGLAKMLPYIKKQELADAMAALAVAQYLGGDKQEGKRDFVRLLVWRPDYQYDTQKLPPKYSVQFEAAQREVEQLRHAPLKIDSTPTGAQAYVDGKYIGVTPCTANDLTIGEHFITLKKDGYKKAVQAAEVKVLRTPDVKVQLQQMEKYLLVEQAVGHIDANLGAEKADDDMDSLKNVLLIDQVVFVKAKAAGNDVDVHAYLYDLRTRTRLSQVEKKAPRSGVEAGLGDLAQTLYTNVSYEGELTAPTEKLPEMRKKPSLFKTWYFWTGVGAVIVVGAGVGTAAYLSRPVSCPEGDSCYGLKY